MFISEAHAQGITGAAGNGGTSSMIMMGAMFFVLWLFILRPQAKRQKEHKELITGLRRGDKVVTDSGIYGEVSKVVDDNVVEVEIATGVKVRLVRNAVSAVLNPKVSDKAATPPKKLAKTPKKATTKKKIINKKKAS